MARAKSKRPNGRPSKYTPELAEQILALMADGLSLTAAAAELNISRRVAYQWRDRNPDFADILDLAQAKRQRFLERRLLTADVGPVVTSTIFALKNCSEEWREKSELEISGKNGGAIQIEDVTRDADAFARRMAGLATAVNGGGTGETDAGGQGGA